VTFPHGYPVMLAVTIVVTTAACTLGALTAKRAGLVAIPLGLAWWALIGFATPDQARHAELEDLHVAHGSGRTKSHRVNGGDIVRQAPEPASRPVAEPCAPVAALRVSRNGAGRVHGLVTGRFARSAGQVGRV
jgi:hypothetical protein